MEQEHMMRQSGIVSTEELEKRSCTLVGAGAIGSFTALALTKMGLKNLDVFDEDGIMEHNIANQFYPIEQIRQFKVDVLQDMTIMFSGTDIRASNKNFDEQKLQETVIVATDSMSSRRVVWDQFMLQRHCKNYIEARMGAELGLVYTMRKRFMEIPANDKGNRLDIEDRDFYLSTLYSDKEAVELPCTARSIIYNVLMISSLICRAYKGIINNEPIPREQIFNMQNLNKASYMVRN